MSLVATRGTSAAVQMWRVYQAQGHTVSVVFRAKSVPSVDYETGLVTQTTTDRTVKGILAGYRNREVDGVRILAGDQQLYCLVSALASLPTLRDVAVLDGDTWDIVTLGDTASGAILVAQLRRVGDVNA